MTAEEKNHEVRSRAGFCRTKNDHKNLRHLFIWRSFLLERCYAVSIYSDGQLAQQRLKRVHDCDGFVELWREWHTFLVGEDQSPPCFEYPVWSINDEHKRGRLRFLIVTTGFLLWSALTGPLLSLLLVLGPLLVYLYALLAHPKFYNSIRLTDNGLEVTFLDGTKARRSPTDVKRFHLDITSGNCFILFKCGLRMAHLERVSYWPLLREQLLSKLQPLQEG